ncbi:hypothetical protein NQ314_010134, partial [Rhamnusium bicolor]
LSKCKVHYSRSGSVYKDFYTISEIPDQNDTLQLDFHFTVLAPSDAHILLAPSENVEKGDPVYEIVIGADGDIAVGKEGEELPFISWVDPDPLPLKEIKKPLTQTERVRQDLLNHYNPYVRPVKNVSTVTTVSMALHINYIQLSWHDEKLKWDPAEYGDLETLHIFRREIWQPDLVLFNAVGDGRDILKDSMMVAHSTGLIEWNPAIYLKAWCDANDMGNWPRDLHKCNLILGLMNDFDYIQLNFNKNDSSLVRY